MATERSLDGDAAWRARVRPELRPLEPYHVPPTPAEVRLDANESPYPASRDLLAELGRLVESAALERYPDPRASRVRSLVARDLAPHGGPPVDENRLVFGNGSDELIALLCQVFAAPPAPGARGTVLFPSPTFSVYRTAALASGMDTVEVPLGPRFEADGERLLEAARRVRPNLVFLATPNNPTGTAWPRAVVERLVAEHPDSIVVIDEAYAPYAGENHLDLVDRAPSCVVLRTYSKVGLAALRLGVLVTCPEVAHEVEKVRAPYNVGLLPQLAAELALGPFRDELSRHVGAIVAERERLHRALVALGRGLEVFPSQANLLLVRVPDASRVFHALLERSIKVRNLDRPGALTGCLRITVGTPDENERLISALHDVL